MPTHRQHPRPNRAPKLAHGGRLRSTPMDLPCPVLRYDLPHAPVGATTAGSAKNIPSSRGHTTCAGLGVPYDNPQCEYGRAAIARKPIDEAINRERYPDPFTERKKPS